MAFGYQYPYAPMGVSGPTPGMAPNYTPYMPPQPQPAQQNNAQGQGILWVQGDAGAKSYLVAPGTTVMLMDSDASRFYLKTADNSGMPTLRTFEYTEVTQNGQQTAKTFPNMADKYVTREEYDATMREISALLPGKKPATAKHVKEGEDA